MNLAYITASFPFGGGETFFIPEIQNLGRSVDGSVVVVPLYPRGERRSDWVPGQANVLVLEERLLSMPIFFGACRTVCKHPLKSFAAFRKIIRLPARHIIKNCAVYPKALWLALQLERLEIGHIHVHWAGTTSTLGMLVSEITGVGWSFTCHRWDIYENNLLSVKSKSAQFTRFISKRGLTDAVQLGVERSKAVVVPMGVNPIYAMAPRSLSDRVPVIMCAANLLEVKGHCYLLQAIALISAAGIPVTLKLAGKGPLQEQLEALVQSLNLDGKVEFLGYLDHPRLLAFYEEDSIDLFVLASVDLGNGHHEGVPVCLMEAMSHGIPVVSTKTGSIEELLEPALGLTVPDKNPAALANAIVSLITEPHRYESVSNQMINIIRDGWLMQNAVQKMIGYMHHSNPT